MSDPQAALRASWKAVVSDLLAQSEQPNSDVPNFSHSQRLNLQLVEPIMIGDGYALIAAPHENAKTVIETELGEYITRALSQHMGRLFFGRDHCGAPAAGTTGRASSTRTSTPHPNRGSRTWHGAPGSGFPARDTKPPSAALMANCAFPSQPR